MTAWKLAGNGSSAHLKSNGASVFVGIVFIAMLAAAHVFVARYSSSVPMRDDLEYTEFLGGPFFIPPAEWWWGPINEHRIPLPRAFYLALVRSTGDIRSGMYFDVYLLGATSLAMILFARRLRGRTSFTDAFFPLMLLTWSNAENLLMMHQVSLIVPSAITCLLLIVFAANPDPPTWKKSLAVGLCIFSLPLCGAPGLTPAPALVLWLVYAGLSRIRSSEPGARKSGAILLSSAIATLLLIALYFVDLENPRSANYVKDPLDVARQAVMFLSLGFGQAAEDYWPLTGWVTAGFLLAALLTLLFVLRTRPEERYRAAGLLAIGAGIVSMAVATGIARGDTYERAAFAMRYVTLPAPIFCCVYLTSCLYGPAALGQIVRVSLYSILLLLMSANVRVGASYGEGRARDAAAFCKGLEDGVTLRKLAVLHWRNFYGSPEDFLLRLEILRRHEFGPLASARASEPMEPYSMLETQPMFVNSPRAGPRKIDGESVFLAPPGCQMHFSLRHGKTVAEGRFGIPPPAYEFSPEGGIRFSIVFVPSAFDPQTIFERVLEPKLRAQDRGPQQFSAPIPPGSEGMIVLVTSFGGEAKDERAFGYWTDFEIR